MSSLIRTRWAAIGAAIAVTLGAGGLGIANASIGSGERAVFVPITPCRVLDTRAGSAVATRQTPLGAGETYTQNAHGNNGLCTGIPTDATALSLNVTAINATVAGTYLTFWPTGASLPDASSLNPVPGQPPTPNAVVTDISTGGQFNIFNFSGTVNLLVDINGYFVDHNHDDRYYTRTEVDAGRTLDKWISIDPLAVNLRTGAVISSGSGANAGLVLPDSGFPFFEFGFTVPPDYTPNAAITVEILWHTFSTSCTIDLFSSHYGVSRRGQPVRGLAARSFSVVSASAPDSVNTTTSSTATVPTIGFGLAPADAVILGFFRGADACSTPIIVTGIRVLYT